MNDENKQVAAFNPRDIQVGSGGVITRNLDEMWVVASKFWKSKTLPTHYDSAEKVFAGMQVCHELGLPLITGMSKLYIVNGVPNLWGDMPLAICRNRDILAYFEEYPIDEKGKRISEANGNIMAECIGYVCKAQRKGSDIVTEQSFTKQDATRAQLFGKKGDLYKKFPKSMYKYKARALVLKEVGADVLAGIDILEHRHHINPDITPEKILRVVENEQIVDFTDAEKRLKDAKDNDELRDIYISLTNEERSHCENLSKELMDEFMKDITPMDPIVDDDGLPDVGQYIDGKCDTKIDETP